MYRITFLIAEKSEDSIDIYGEWKVSDPVWNALFNEVHCEKPFGKNDARVGIINT